MEADVGLDWKTKLSETLQDYPILLVTTLCPALAFHSASENFEVPPAGFLESIVGGYCPCYAWTLRKRLRDKYNLRGSTLKDFVAHLCCHVVALAVVWNESRAWVEAPNGPEHRASHRLSNASPPTQTSAVPVQRFSAHTNRQVGFPPPLSVRHETSSRSPNPPPPISEPSIGTEISPAVILQQAENSSQITTDTQSVPLFDSISSPTVEETGASSSARRGSTEQPPVDSNLDSQDGILSPSQKRWEELRRRLIALRP